MDLFIESIAMYHPHVRRELADQGQVRILATGTFSLSTHIISPFKTVFSFPFSELGIPIYNSPLASLKAEAQSHFCSSQCWTVGLREARERCPCPLVMALLKAKAAVPLNWKEAGRLNIPFRKFMVIFI